MTKNSGNYVFLRPQLPMAGPYVPLTPPLPMAGAYAPLNPPLPMAGMGQVEAWQPNVLGEDVSPPTTSGIIDSLITMLSDIPWWGWVGGGVACYWLANKTGILRNPDDYYQLDDVYIAPKATKKQKAGEPEEEIEEEIEVIPGYEHKFKGDTKVVVDLMNAQEEQKSQQQAASIAITANLPVLIWGPPGIGKTEWVYALGRAIGAKVTVVLASTKDPADIAGIPRAKTGEVIPPPWAKDIDKSRRSGKKNILFLDEFTASIPMVQAALLRVVREKFIGELDLDPPGVPEDLRVRVVAAANEKEYSAAGMDLPAASANRFIHLKWRAPDRSMWAKGILYGDWGEQYIFEVTDNWRDSPEHFSARADVAAFLQRYPALRHNMPERDRKRQGMAWASPRTWEMAADALGAVRFLRRDHTVADRVESILIRGSVGNDAGKEFEKWLLGKNKNLQERKAMRMISDVEDILEQPKKWDIPINDKAIGATKGALFNMVISIMKRPTLERWYKGWNVLKFLNDEAEKTMKGTALKGFKKTALVTYAAALDDMVDDTRFPNISSEKIKEAPPGFEEILVPRASQGDE